MSDDTTYLPDQGELGGPRSLCLDGGLDPEDAGDVAVVGTRPAGVGGLARERYGLCRDCASLGPEETWEEYQVLDGEVPEGSPWARQIAREEIAREDIVIVDDHHAPWGIRRSDLLIALEDLGWEQSGSRWDEPDHECSGEECRVCGSGGPYQALCDSANVAEGWEPGPRADAAARDRDVAALRYRPDIASGAWMLE